MTPEQVALEFERIRYDEQLKKQGDKVYEDEDFDKYDEESDAYDSNISNGYQASGLPNKDDPDEWEEINDDEGE